MKTNAIYVLIPSPVIGKGNQVIGANNFTIMGAVELERFIVKQLFPVGVVPGGVVSYLYNKNLRVIKHIRDYVFANSSSSKEKPISVVDLKKIIVDALNNFDININDLRSYDEIEVNNWKVSRNVNVDSIYRDNSKKINESLDLGKLVKPKQITDDFLSHLSDDDRKKLAEIDFGEIKQRQITDDFLSHLSDDDRKKLAEIFANSSSEINKRSRR